MPVRRPRRPLAALCALVPLVLAATSCSDSSAGPITGTRGATFSQSIRNPTQGGGNCHAFDPLGVDRVVNDTNVDIRLYKGLHCTNPLGNPSAYLARTFSATTAGTIGLWRSFSTVGWAPPVPAHTN